MIDVLDRDVAYIDETVKAEIRKCEAERLQDFRKILRDFSAATLDWAKDNLEHWKQVQADL